MSLGQNTAADVFGFAGSRGSDNFATNDRPGNYREMLLMDFPTGTMALTGLTAMIWCTIMTSRVLEVKLSTIEVALQ